MPADIVERLRHASTSTTKAKLCAEAAAEISALRQQLAEASADCKRANEMINAAVADYNDARAKALEEAAALADELDPNAVDIAAAIRALAAGKEG